MTPELETQVRMKVETAKALSEFATARGLGSRGDAVERLLDENKAFYKVISEEIDGGALGSCVIKMIDDMIVNRIKERRGASTPDIVAWLVNVGITCNIEKIARFVDQRLDMLADNDRIMTVFTVGGGSFWAVHSQCKTKKKEK